MSLGKPSFISLLDSPPITSSRLGLTHKSMISRILYSLAAFCFSCNVSSDSRFSFQVDQQISTELEQAAERGMVFTRSQDNTPAGGVTQASKSLYPQVVVPEKKRKVGNGGKESPAQPLAKKRRRSVKSNGDAAPSSNKLKPGRPRINGAANTKDSDAVHVISHNHSDQGPSSPGARPTPTSTPGVATGRTIDDDKENNTIDLAMNKPDQMQGSGNEILEAHDQMRISDGAATRKKKRKISEVVANVDKNGADSNIIGKKPEIFIGTATKVTHKRFGSEDIEVLETNSSAGIGKRKERQEDVSEGETDSADEAPETVTASAGFDKARISALEAARVTARYVLRDYDFLIIDPRWLTDHRQKAGKKHKRREHDQRLRLQAKSAKDSRYDDKPSTEGRRTKASPAKITEADGQTPVEGSKSRGRFPDATEDEDWRPSAKLRTSGKTPLPLLLPEEILAAQPVVHAPTSTFPTFPNSKVDISQKRKFLDLKSKPPKDIKRGGVTIRVLQDNRSILPPKSSQASKTLRESWLSGRRGFKGEIGVPRRKLGGGFIRRRR